MRDGIALFQAAERLGFQSGWAYQRHFDNYLSSPLPFFAAVGQHTERITLGSAVIPMRYQDPILLAEAAGITDLLVGGRLNLALSSGRTGFERVFWHEKADARVEGQRRLARFLRGVEGKTLHVVEDSDEATLAPGTWQRGRVGALGVQVAAGCLRARPGAGVAVWVRSFAGSAPPPAGSAPPPAGSAPRPRGAARERAGPPGAAARIVSR